MFVAPSQLSNFLFLLQMTFFFFFENEQFVLNHEQSKHIILITISLNISFYFSKALGIFMTFQETKAFLLKYFWVEINNKDYFSCGKWVGHDQRKLSSTKKETDDSWDTFTIWKTISGLWGIDWAGLWKKRLGLLWANFGARFLKLSWSKIYFFFS